WRRHGADHDLAAGWHSLAPRSHHLPPPRQGGGEDSSGTAGQARGCRTVTAAPLLTVEHLTMRFGVLVAVDDVSFIANDCEITGVIGPNGAGKTTVFNCLTGFYKPTVGRLSLSGARGRFLLEQMDGYKICQKAGVARTFQNIRLFAGMSVLENLMVAQHNKLIKA